MATTKIVVSDTTPATEFQARHLERGDAFSWTWDDTKYVGVVRTPSTYGGFVTAIIILPGDAFLQHVHIPADKMVTPVNKLAVDVRVIV